MICTISGSFRKFYREVCEAYDIFEQNGISVLSPRKSSIINLDDDFVLLKTDSKELTRRQIVDKHLEAIAQSDFLYIMNPNGYAGDSTKFELGYAHGRNKPIYSLSPMENPVLGEYVSKILSPRDLVDYFKRSV